MNILTRDLKRHAIIGAVAAKHCDLNTSNCLHVARSFFHKVQLELEGCAGNISLVERRENHSHHPDTLTTPEFIRDVQSIVDENPGISIRSIAKEI